MKSVFTFFIGVFLIAGLSLAQVTFTGDASEDFGTGTVWVNDACGEDDVNITSAMRNAGVLSGWDMYRVGFNYDRSTDILYIGIDYNGRICGDADGDGDPGDETYLTGGSADIENLGDGEVIAIWLDTDNSGGPNGWDVICGVQREDEAEDYNVFTAIGGWGNPNSSFGNPIATSSGSSLYTSPDEDAPDFECTITNFSQLEGFSFDPVTDDVTFGVYAYSGSFEDGGVGYDKLLDSWATVDIDGPVIPDILTHSYPQDLYVMEGIPLQVEDGDPPTLFGPPFSTNPPGWPWWRVSRWSSELQTYERYQEENWPIPIGGEPPDQNPGMGFWVVQDIDDPAVITVTGEFFEEGATITQDLQVPYPDGRRGLSQIANPFHFPITWGDAWIQIADQTEDPMTIEEAAAEEIICRYAVSWDVFNLQYITNDVGATLGMWTGFWVEQYDLDNEYIIGFDYPATDNIAGTTNSGGKGPALDDYYEWSFSIGVIAESIGLYDCLNFLGISPDAQNDFDQYDAHEFAPQVTDGGYVHLYFPHIDWTEYPGNYAYDIRQGPFVGERTWDFNVRSSQYTGAVIIAWDGMAKASPEYELALLDGAGNVLVEDMTLVENTTISISSDEILDYQIRVTGLGSGVGEGTSNTPAEFALKGVYPNPFNPSTNVAFSLDRQASVEFAVYDISGRLVKSIASEDYQQGSHSVKIDLENLPSGIYLLSASADGSKFGTQKLVLMK